LAEDRERVAAGDVQALERTVRGAGPARDRRALLEGERLGQRDERVRGRRLERRVPAVARHAVHDDALAAELRPADAAVLAAAAALVVVDHHALARRRVGFGDARPAPGDDAARLVAGDDRSARAAQAQRRRSVADGAVRVQIAAAHSRRLHGDDDLAGTRCRVREITKLELSASEKNYAAHKPSFAATLARGSRANEGGVHADDQAR